MVCKHLWVCPQSEAHTVWATCKWCGDYREFNNAPGLVLEPDAIFEGIEWDGEWDNAVKAIEESR